MTLPTTDFALRGEQVNGEAETRRGRKLRAGDVVALGDAQVRLQASAPGTAGQ